MTANLLAHSDLFRAGIARSGAYNRTLTPFGFQSEERTLWQAPEIYFEMSPFMHAEKIDEPILLIHGEADNNSGTFPSRANGSTVRWPATAPLSGWSYFPMKATVTALGVDPPHALGDVRVVGSLRQTGPTATRTRIGHGDPVATEQPRQ